MKDIAREFFILRFGRMPETDTAYYAEWERRFSTGHPETYMDMESRRAYNKVRLAHGLAALVFDKGDV